MNAFQCNVSKLNTFQCNIVLMNAFQCSIFKMNAFQYNVCNEYFSMQYCSMNAMQYI